MSWKRVQVNGLENADDAVFCGLEEISYSDYLKLRTSKKGNIDIHIGGVDVKEPTPTITYEEEIGQVEGNSTLGSSTAGKREKKKKVFCFTALEELGVKRRLPI